MHRSYSGCAVDTSSADARASTPGGPLLAPLWNLTFSSRLASCQLSLFCPSACHSLAESISDRLACVGSGVSFAFTSLSSLPSLAWSNNLPGSGDQVGSSTTLSRSLNPYWWLLSTFLDAPSHTYPTHQANLDADILFQFDRLFIYPIIDSAPNYWVVMFVWLSVCPRIITPAN